MARRKTEKKYDTKTSKWVEETIVEDVSKDIIIETVEGEKGEFKIINNDISLKVVPINKPDINTYINHIPTTDKFNDYVEGCCMGVGFPSHIQYD